MSLLEIAKDCDKEVKKTFRKFSRFEARVTKSLGALKTALGDGETKDVSLDRAAVMKAEIEKAFKAFQSQFESSCLIFDEK